MTKKAVLYDKIYNQKKGLVQRYKRYLDDVSQGFPNTHVWIKKLREYDKRFQVDISGAEEVFIYNLLRKEIGMIERFENVKVNNVFRGTLIDTGKVGFGLFVDCAILDPKTDVLLSLHSLREQLCNSKEKSLKEIIKIYDLIDHFPVSIKIKEIDVENKKIQGILDENTLNFYDDLIKRNLEAIFLSGETKAQFKRALIKTGHLRDIVSIQHYGFLENIVVLKENTESPGIIAEIGKYLRNCKMSVIRPNRIKSLFY